MSLLNNCRTLTRCDEWDEAMHSRDENGRFGPGGGVPAANHIMRYATTSGYNTPSDEDEPENRLAEALVKHGYLTASDHGTVRSYKATPRGHIRWTSGDLAEDLTDETRSNYISKAGK